MNVFLSYSSDQEDRASRIAYALRDEGDSVFFDRSSLPAGETYDLRIREAIEGSDLFLFLVSPEAIAPGSYALAELSIVEHASSASGLTKVLPVMVADTDFKVMPPFLRGITILQPRGDVVAEILASSAEVREELNRQQVSISTMSSGAGWTIMFQFWDEHLREVLYRFGDQPDFTSTGWSQRLDRRTRLPEPNLSVTVPTLEGKHELFLKYIDSRGRERGPYRLQIDAKEQMVAYAKQVLEMMPAWIGFREYEGFLLAYFTYLLMWKNALREVRYSVDDESLSRRVRFAVVPSDAAVQGIDDNDEVTITLPSLTRYLFVKLIFIDGSEWPARRFDRPGIST